MPTSRIDGGMWAYSFGLASGGLFCAPAFSSLLLLLSRRAFSGPVFSSEPCWQASFLPRAFSGRAFSGPASFWELAFWRRVSVAPVSVAQVSVAQVSVAWVSWPLVWMSLRRLRRVSGRAGLRVRVLPRWSSAVRLLLPLPLLLRNLLPANRRRRHCHQTHPLRHRGRKGRHQKSLFPPDFPPPSAPGSCVSANMRFREIKRQLAGHCSGLNGARL